MSLNNHIEALLFLSGEPISVNRLAKILEKKEGEIKKALSDLEENLKERGVRLLKKDGEIMLGTAPESAQYCETLVKEELNKNLGQAGLEILAIILYKPGRVSKTDIDSIRGVNSTFTLRNLLIRGFVERQPNPKDKRSYLYTPSMQILQYLGIAKKEDLPEFEKFIEQLKNVVNEHN